MNNWMAIAGILIYLSILFGVAYYAEYKMRKGKSIINNPYVYALSLGYIARPGLTMGVLSWHLTVALNS